MKRFIFISACLVFLTTQTSVNDAKRILYPSFINSAQAGAIVGVLAPTTHSSFFLFTVLTSPLYNTIPLVLGLINVIIALKKERNGMFGFQNYYSNMPAISFNNLIESIGIASACFLVTIFTYYTCFDIANSLKQACIKLHKKLTA